MTVSGTTTLLRLVLSLKAFGPSLVNGSPSMVSGRIKSPVTEGSQPSRKTTPSFTNLAYLSCAGLPPLMLPLLPIVRTVTRNPFPVTSKESGFVPAVVSAPSRTPSSSVSATKGSVPKPASLPSIIPSSSVSATSGSVPSVISSPSLRPSSSVSAISKLVFVRFCSR